MTTRAARWLDRFAAALWILAIAFSFGGFTLIASGFHVWFIPRPLGMLEASGKMLPL